MSSSASSNTRIAHWAHTLGLSIDHFKVAAVVSFYMVAALVMVFVNKAVLLSAPTLPLLFLLIQLVMAVILLHVTALIFPRHIQLPRLELATARKLAPVIGVSLCGLVFNTLCLRSVEAAFFQIARGLTLPLTIVISALFTRALPTPTWPVFIAALIVTLGFLLGVAPSGFGAPRVVDLDGENAGVVAPNPKAVTTPLALTYGILSAGFVALHSCLIKASLPHVQSSALHLAYWTNLVSALILAPIVVVVGEAAEFLRLAASDWAWGTFAWGSAVTGVFGALLGLAGMLSVQVTSPVTHMFSSAGKSVLQTVLGVWLFHDLMNSARASSIFVILLGTLYYTWVKSQPQPQQPARQAPVAAEKAEEEALVGRKVDFVVEDEDDV